MSCWNFECCGKKIILFGCGDGEIDMSTQALGLPPKSVRALLAFVVVIITFICFMGAVAIFAVNEEYDLLLGALAAMTNVMSAIIGFYFGSRGSTQEKRRAIMPPPIDVERQLSKTTSDESDDSYAGAED